MKWLTFPSKRSGDTFKEARFKNDVLMFLLLAAASILWVILSKYFFTEFKISSYWMIKKDFIANILPVAIPLLIYATLSTIVNNKTSEMEEKFLVGRPLFPKIITALKAGVLEELSHRGVFIYFALIAVAVGNAFFNILIWVIAGIIIIALMSTIFKKKKTFIGFIFGLVFAGTLIYFTIKLVGIIPENPAYLLNGLVLKFYQWLTGNKMILGIALTVITLSTGVMLTRPLNGLIFIAWCMYALPLAIGSIATATIIPEGADKMTYLCYIGALFYVNVKFSKGHEYQGPFGVVNSYFFGLYMCHICFVYGLIYAIIAHFIYDAVVFTIEHSFWFVKNTHIKKIN